MFSVLIWFGKKVYFTLASSPNLGQSTEKIGTFARLPRKMLHTKLRMVQRKKKSMPCVWANCHMICYNFKGIRIFASCLHASMSSRGGDHNFGRKKSHEKNPERVYEKNQQIRIWLHAKYSNLFQTNILNKIKIPLYYPSIRMFSIFVVVSTQDRNTFVN